MADDTLSWKFKLIAIAAVLAVLGVIRLYMLEFPVFTNTIHAQMLVSLSILVGLLISGNLFYVFRARFMPLELHLPEFFSTLIFTLFLSPLLGSLLNRGLGHTEHHSFEFLTEKPYASSTYGMMLHHRIHQTGFLLEVRDQGELWQFRYRKQAYYPLTKPGDPILLPMRVGLFGFRVMLLP
jgi:hypothetical protein